MAVCPRSKERSDIYNLLDELEKQVFHGTLSELDTSARI